MKLQQTWGFPEHLEVQKQIQKSKQAQELLFTLQQDMLNFLGVLYETQTVINYFKSNEAHPMIPQNINRLIAQSSLSSTVHFDLMFANQEDLKSELLREQQRQRAIIKDVLQQNCWDGRIRKYLEEYYEISLSESPKCLFYPSHQVEQRAEHFRLDQNLVSKVISSMQGWDLTLDRLRRGEDKFKLLEKEEIIRYLQAREENAKKKLEAAWPKPVPIKKRIIRRKMKKSGIRKLQR